MSINQWYAQCQLSMHSGSAQSVHKKDKGKIGANTYEVLVSYGEPDELIQQALSQVH